MTRFEQVVQVVQATETQLSPLASAVTMIVTTGVLLAIAVFLTTSMWQNRES